MKNTLFDCELLQKKTVIDKPRKYKPIPLDKYIIMCEKEMINYFLSDITLFATLKRISNGWCKGDYEAEINFEDFIHVKISNEPYQDKNNVEKVDNYLKGLKCNFAEFYYDIPCNDILNRYGKYRSFNKVKMTFRILNSFKADVIEEYKTNIGIFE
jgi:hypothetical protein